MNKTRENILKLIECFKDGRFNFLNLEIKTCENIIFHPNTIKFDHRTGFDSEEITGIDNICNNNYASKMIDDNIDELIRKINLFAKKRKERSIL